MVWNQVLLARGNLVARSHCSNGGVSLQKNLLDYLRLSNGMAVTAYYTQDAYCVPATLEARPGPEALKQTEPLPVLTGQPGKNRRRPTVHYERDGHSHGGGLAPSDRLVRSNLE